MSNTFPWKDFKNKAKKENHSDSYITATEKYTNNLKSKNLPVLFSTKHLSAALEISYKELVELIRDRETHYSQFKIRKKRGGVRNILSPDTTLKYIHRCINNSILSKFPISEYCFSFKEGHSIKQNAKVHVNQYHIFKLDLYKFFESITEKRVYGIFHKVAGYHKNISVDLAKLCTYFPSKYYWEHIIEEDPPQGFNVYNRTILPQGAPTSPALSNLVVYKLDRRLSGLAHSLHLNYSRYADDLTFSGNEESNFPISTIEKIIREEGFFINSSKTYLRKRGQRQLVNGLTITNGVHVPKTQKNEIWKHLYFARKYGPINHLEFLGLEDKSSFKEWLLGHISYVYSIEPEVGKKMLDSFNKIIWPL